jgi:hypothetical protein
MAVGARLYKRQVVQEGFVSEHPQVSLTATAFHERGGLS